MQEDIFGNIFEIFKTTFWEKHIYTINRAFNTKNNKEKSLILKSDRARKKYKNLYNNINLKVVKK